MANQPNSTANQIFQEKLLSLKRSEKIPQTYPIIQIIILTLIFFLLMCYLYDKTILQTEPGTQLLISQQKQQETIIVNPQHNKFNSKTQYYISLYCNKQSPQCKGEDLANINEVLALLQNQQFSQVHSQIAQQPAKERRTNHQQQEKMEELKLFVVKNEKMTTPTMRQEGLWSFFMNKLIYANPYQNIDDIVGQNKNNFYWKTNKRLSMISVRSTTDITPSIVQIQALTDFQEELSILGLAYGPLNEILGVNLGKYPLQNGINKIKCHKQECKGRYPIIMMIITNIKVKSLKIYNTKE